MRFERVSGLALDTSSKFINGNEFEYGTRMIREAHEIKNPESVRYVGDIIKESLNIGAARLGIKIGKENLYKYIRKFKFGEVHAIGLPGESTGIVKKPSNWYKSDEAIIPFGHSIAVTPLQLVSAVATIGNDGRYVKPKIVRKITDDSGNIIKSYVNEILYTRIIDTQTASDIKKMLIDCVENGTGTNARIAGYMIGGKTGTSQKVSLENEGYAKGKYVSSFVGLIPGENPKIAMLVVVDNPKNKYYGGTVAAPIFKNITEEIVRYLSIPPTL